MMNDWNLIQGTELNRRIARLLGYQVIQQANGSTTVYILVSPPTSMLPPTPLNRRSDEESAWSDTPDFCGNEDIARILRSYVNMNTSTPNYNFMREKTPDRNAAYYYQPQLPLSSQPRYHAEAEGENDESFTLATCRLVGMLLDEGIVKAPIA